MQRDFNNRDFEQFLKQNADQYRMFPSEKVWQGINSALHTRRRWYGAGLALLLLLTGTAVTLVMTNIPGNNTAESTEILLSPQDIVRKEKIRTPTPNTASSTTAIHIPLLNSPEVVFPANTATVVERNIYPADQQHIAVQVTPSIASTVSSVIAALPSKTADITTLRSPVSGNPNLAAFSFAISGATQEPTPTIDNKSLASPATVQATERPTDSYPLTIESVVNSYKPSVAKRKRFAMQFHIAPTISYRKLSENKKFLRSAAANGSIPSYAAYSDINNYVSHKPDMGLELGFTGKYALSNHFRLRAGLQFNVSRYDIKAFDYLREDATIALDDASQGPNHTITKKTNYRNNINGNNPNWLKNLYYSASLPIGAELTFKSSTNAHFGIAATVQPTYIIKNRAFLITTDYKNYVEVPSLVRKWNVNSSFEAFIGYSTGNINWQIGPQIRYQIQSSFISKYPVKENLFDFGLKVGLQLNR